VRRQIDPWDEHAVLKAIDSPAAAANVLSSFGDTPMANAFAVGTGRQPCPSIKKKAKREQILRTKSKLSANLA
jgi:hypothetical protein